MRSTLRRTSSAPATRSSPYPSSLSLNSSSNRPAAAVARGGGPHRRASGSDTMNRRVLAEIDWWTVTEGQHQDLKDDTSAPTPIPTTPTGAASNSYFYEPLSMADLDNFMLTGSVYSEASAPASTRAPVEAPTQQMQSLSLTTRDNGAAASDASNTASGSPSPVMPSTPLQTPFGDFSPIFSSKPTAMDLSFYDDPMYSSDLSVYEAPLEANNEYVDFSSFSGFSDIMH